MSRVWTCQGCKTQHPRTKQKCSCGRKRPAARKPAHRAVLDSMPYEAWVERFGDACNICGKVPTEGQMRLNRDHAHNGTRAGEARGLLCGRCNRALPNWMDAAWLASATAYLRRFERPAVRYCRDCADCGGCGSIEPCAECGHAPCDGNAAWPVPMEGASG